MGTFKHFKIAAVFAMSLAAFSGTAHATGFIGQALKDITPSEWNKHIERIDEKLKKPACQMGKATAIAECAAGFAPACVFIPMKGC